MDFSREIDVLREKLEDARQDLLYTSANDVSAFNKLCRSLDSIYHSISKFTLEHHVEVLKIMHEQAQDRIGYKFPPFDPDCIENDNSYSQNFTLVGDHIITINIMLYADCAVDLSTIVYDSAAMPPLIKELEYLMPRGIHPFALMFKVTENDEIFVTVYVKSGNVKYNRIVELIPGNAMQVIDAIGDIIQ